MRLPEIAVCVCTFKRPALIQRLLSELERQETGGRFTFRIVVVDNDANASASHPVMAVANRSAVPISYEVEANQNIALARNRAVASANSDLVAFIDDDEVPTSEWLKRLHTTLTTYTADGVLGPVKPFFETMPPAWAARSSLFDRPRYQTGVTIHWKDTGTGNVLVRRAVLDAVHGPFKAEFGSGGEDLDFFRRAIDAGYVFVGCEDAVVHEPVPAERTRLSFQLKRALLRGKTSLAAPLHVRRFGVAKSLVACLLYTLLLPVFFVAGRHVFVEYLVKDFDHLGKLMAFCGIDVLRQKYVLK